MKNSPHPSRRQFLKTSMAAPAVLAGAGATAAPGKAEGSALESSVLPRRKLGRNGPEVTMLSLGGSMTAHSPQYLNLAWSNGVRSFDTSPAYIKGKSEQHIGSWNAKYPERRKELFLVTKEPSRSGPEEMLANIDVRLETCQTDYIDLLFLHGIGIKKHGKDSIDWPRSDRLRKIVDQLKSSGKVKMVGFSCHDDELATYLNNAAEGGFIDAIMLKYNPFFAEGGDFDQALDHAYDKGIGLISMKEMRAFASAPKRTPEMEKVNLTTQQALLHKVWSDHRISAICSKMGNVMEIEENCVAARVYEKPLPMEQIKALQEVASVMPVPMCPGCPSCTDGARHTDLAYTDISRYVCYYEQDGDTSARELYRQLPASRRQAAGTDLVALRDQCQYKVDYPDIVRRAEAYFG